MRRVKADNKCHCLTHAEGPHQGCLLFDVNQHAHTSRPGTASQASPLTTAFALPAPRSHISSSPSSWSGWLRYRDNTIPFPIFNKLTLPFLVGVEPILLKKQQCGVSSVVKKKGARARFSKSARGSMRAECGDKGQPSSVDSPGVQRPLLCFSWERVEERVRAHSYVGTLPGKQALV